MQANWRHAECLGGDSVASVKEKDPLMSHEY